MTFGIYPRKVPFRPFFASDRTNASYPFSTSGVPSVRRSCVRSGGAAGVPSLRRFPVRWGGWDTCGPQHAPRLPCAWVEQLPHSFQRAKQSFPVFSMAYALLRKERILQPDSFQAHPHSWRKTPGVGGTRRAQKRRPKLSPCKTPLYEKRRNCFRFMRLRARTIRMPG